MLQCANFDYSKLTYKELTLCLFEFIILKHVNVKNECYVVLVSSSISTSTNIQLILLLGIYDISLNLPYFTRSLLTQT